MELSIDAVGEISSVAVSERGALLAEITWASGRRHTPSLIPMIDRACEIAAGGRDPAAIKPRLELIIVDVGPGAYGGIRAGMAAAEGMAIALGLPCVGVGRLEIEAWAHAGADPVTAIHRAARGAWAWQTFRGSAGAWRADCEPRTGAEPELRDALAHAGGAVCGDVALLSEPAPNPIGSPANARRAALLAELGWRAYAQSGGVAPGELQPLYLREPAIGPQPRPPGE